MIARLRSLMRRERQRALIEAVAWLRDRYGWPMMMHGVADVAGRRGEHEAAEVALAAVAAFEAAERRRQPRSLQVIAGGKRRGF